MNKKKGRLYVVATPIGNLNDITYRAIEALKTVDLIAAEDTRHSRPLLEHYGIKTPLTSLHEHNEDRKSPILLESLKRDLSVALICDAGTPLISDPGYQLVRLAHQSKIEIVAIPGPSAVIAALSISGLATDRFSFEGFPPRTRTKRKEKFQQCRDRQSTLVFYESNHRIRDCLKDIYATFPDERAITIARELTKIHETIICTNVGSLADLMESGSFITKGEFVLLIEGASRQTETGEISEQNLRVLTILLEKCSLKDTVAISQKITGISKKILYRHALSIKRNPSN